MPEVEYVCAKCGHAEPVHKKNMIWRLFLTMMSLLGMLFIIFLIFIGPEIMLNGVMDTFHTYYAKTNSNEIRHLALNNTTYSGDNPFMWALDLAQNIGDIRYVPANKYDMIQAPEETELYGGDCKNTAILYTSMLDSLDIQAKVWCSTEQRHCVTRIDDAPYYMVVDFASGFWLVFNQSDDFWSESLSALAYGQMRYKEPLSVVEPRYFKKLTECCEGDICYQSEYCELQE